jgi:hypothetical protein
MTKIFDSVGNVFFGDKVSSIIDIIRMNAQKNPQSLLQQIAQIQRMERGKLSVIREGPSGPYYKLQAWEKDKNVSRYIPRELAPAVEEAIAGYKQFQELTGQYAQDIIERTRAAIAADSKKKKAHPSSSSRKTPKSSS